MYRFIAIILLLLCSTAIAAELQAVRIEYSSKDAVIRTERGIMFARSNIDTGGNYITRTIARCNITEITRTNGVTKICTSGGCTSYTIPDNVHAAIMIWKSEKFPNEDATPCEKQ